MMKSGDFFKRRRLTVSTAGVPVLVMTAALLLTACTEKPAFSVEIQETAFAETEFFHGYDDVEDDTEDAAEPVIDEYKASTVSSNVRDRKSVV